MRLLIRMASSPSLISSSSMPDSSISSISFFYFSYIHTMSPKGNISKAISWLEKYVCALRLVHICSRLNLDRKLLRELYPRNRNDDEKLLVDAR